MGEYIPFHFEVDHHQLLEKRIQWLKDRHMGADWHFPSTKFYKVKIYVHIQTIQVYSSSVSLEM